MVRTIGFLRFRYADPDAGRDTRIAAGFGQTGRGDRRFASGFLRVGFADREAGRDIRYPDLSINPTIPPRPIGTGEEGREALGVWELEPDAVDDDGLDDCEEGDRPPVDLPPTDATASFHLPPPLDLPPPPDLPPPTSTSNSWLFSHDFLSQIWKKIKI
ncbi:hypothetical protein Bca52824_023608 [Brassica carinata]|uniref:Uncharacterized protein n=1 Tax=Brassica carinata TaxID=52824 RepID=A0A8X7VJ00_BRACI|nr:hypothetical protein Bca52824_023608 [Brassica carinata]